VEALGLLAVLVTAILSTALAVCTNTAPAEPDQRAVTSVLLLVNVGVLAWMLSLWLRLQCGCALGVARSITRKGSGRSAEGEPASARPGDSSMRADRTSARIPSEHPEAASALGSRKQQSSRAAAAAPLRRASFSAIGARSGSAPHGGTSAAHSGICCAQRVAVAAARYHGSAAGVKSEDGGITEVVNPLRLP
jgi:hypothetical protein